MILIIAIEIEFPQNQRKQRDVLRRCKIAVAGVEELVLRL